MRIFRGALKAHEAKASHVPVPQLPAGEYVFVLQGLGESYGGLTSSVLARARSFVEVADQPVTIALIGPVPRFDTLAIELIGRGAIPAHGVTFRSLHQEFAQDSTADASRPAGIDVAGLDSEVVRTYVSGQPWQLTLTDADTGLVRCREHRSEDGWPYLRQHVEYNDEKSSTSIVERLDSTGAVLQSYPSIPAMYRAWFSSLLGEVNEVPKFAVVDAPRASQNLLGLVRPDLYRIFTVHNTHVAPPGRYDGTLKGDRAHMFEKVSHLDGLVVLTDRQREDVELRYGPLRNLFTVPHASRPLPSLPPPDARASRRAVVLARLAGSKRVTHIVRAFALALGKVSDATLDIYGDGPDRAMLERLVSDLGVGHSVHFHGFEPGAAKQFQTATLFAMASVWEGQPLTILEAMGAGCPVVSYDIKYGPADAIEPGRTGLLVPEGDIHALGDAMVRMFTNPELAREMSRAAWERSHEFDAAHMMERWQGVFEQVLRERPTRTKLDPVSIADVTMDGDGTGTRLRAKLSVTGKIPRKAVGREVIRWLLIGRDTADQVAVEASVNVLSQERGAVDFEVSGRLPTATIAGLLEQGAGSVDVYLDLTWNNSHQRCRLAAPTMPQGPIVAYTTQSGDLSFHRANA